MRLTASQYANALLALSESTEDPKHVASSFLSYARKNRLTKKLSDILRIFERLLKSKEGKLLLLIETARNANAAERETLRCLAEATFPGKRLSLRYIVNADLVGGVRMLSYDEMVDATIRRRLDELEKIIR